MVSCVFFPARGATLPASVGDGVPAAGSPLDGRWIALGEPSYAPALRASEKPEIFDDDLLFSVSAPAEKPCAFVSAAALPPGSLPVQIEADIRGTGTVELAVFFCDAQGAVIGKQGRSFILPELNRMMFGEFKCGFNPDYPAGTAAVRFGFAVAPGGDVVIKGFEGGFDG